MIGSWWIRFRRGVTRLISGQSLQWRLALLTGLSVALSVILVGSTTFPVTRWSLTDQLDRELTSVAQTASAAVATALDSNEGLTASIDATNGLLAVVSASGVVQQNPGQEQTDQEGKAHGVLRTCARGACRRGLRG